MQYARINYGPVPEKFDTLYESLHSLEAIIVDDTTYHGYPAKIIKVGRAPYAGALSAKEVEIAESVREYFKDYNASAIAEYSHKEIAWLEVPNGSRISYDYSDAILDADKIVNA
ncbi:type II toxin-antitoxin system antitoxin SocA domain-containing protein, partial [Roseibium sp.]